jgi:NitT/TauT family transport system substrate-binding protein
MEYFLEQVLERWGLSFDEVKPVYQAESVRAQALEMGAVDATLLAESLVTRLLLSGRGEVLAYEGELYGQVTTMPPQTSLVYFGPALLVDHPEWGRRFMLGYLRGVRTYNQGKTPRNLEIISGYTDLEPDTLTQTGWPQIHPDGRMSQAGISEYQQWLLRQDLVDRTIPVNALFEPGFAAWAAKTLGEYSD